MGYTNTTAHYELPQYVATDKPKYLTDFNQTMEAIDTQMYVNAQAAATADGKAVAAKDTADGAVSSIGTLNTQINGDALDPSDRGLAGDVSDNSGAINTINSLIGNGEPTTSDKTIIGAINEIYADITGGGTDVSAANVSYDNTTSGLTADDVQEAIDEVYAAIPSVSTPDAEDVTYDNTTSGLVATNVQAAIDELAQGGASVDYKATEEKIGTFLGEDLYQKTITVSSLSSGVQIIDATLTTSYIKDLVSIEGSVLLSNGSKECLQFVRTDGNAVTTTVTSSGLNCNVTLTTITASDLVVTVRYTKN